MAIKIQGTTVIDDGRQLNVIGVNTISNVEISSGIVTAVSGVVTYYGDGSNLDGIQGGAAISTNTTNQAQYIPYATSFGSTTGFGATESFVFNPSTGILTAPNFSGDGSRLSNTNGFATPLSSNPSDGLYGIYKENKVLTINSGIHTVESDSNQDKLAFTKADTIVISAGATLNISSGTTFRTNIINLFPADEDLNIFGYNLNVTGVSTLLSTVSIGTTIKIVPYNSLETLSFEGSAGQLFSITNNLISGSIFSVNDVSGIPSIDVDADGTIQLATYGGNVGVGTTNPTEKIDVVGNVKISGSITKGSGTFTIPHPIDSSKLLVHSFIEGPKADLIYRGKSKLSDGISTIVMDSHVGLITGTWESLCRNPQVFVQNNESFALVKASITEDGILTITSNENINHEIDWMVIAERDDEVIKDAHWTDNDGNPILEPMNNVR